MGGIKDYVKEGLDWQLKNVYGVSRAPSVRTPRERTEMTGGSPANNLEDRTNRARPRGRIPDHYGTVKIIPDLIMVPYVTYEDHRAVETAYYCIGRGNYSTTAIKDGDQLISSIEGASAYVYPAGEAPGPFGTPDVAIGPAIPDRVMTVKRVKAVNGQQLSAYADRMFYGSAMVPKNVSPSNPTGESLAVCVLDYLGASSGRIGLPFAGKREEITDRVKIGDRLTVFWPTSHLPAGTGTAPDLETPRTVDFPLDFEALTVIDIRSPGAGPGGRQRVDLYVTIPASQQAQWALLATYFGQPIVDFAFAHFTVLDGLYQGPFFIDFQHPPGSSQFELICNFVAPEGCYRDDGTTILAIDKQIEIVVTPANTSGSAIGSPERFIGKLLGSAVTKGQRAITIRCRPTGFGTNTRCLVQARLLTNSPRRERQMKAVEDSRILGVAPYSGRVVDEVRWVDCYTTSVPTNQSFGGVTTIHTRTIANEESAALRERELNLIATRLVNTWNGSVFGPPALPSGNAEDILMAVMKDLSIGNLPDAQIDFAGIAAACEAVRESVFDTSPLSTTFSHTFDEDLTLEETINVICQACFLTPYRRGRVISVRPDIATDDSVLVLNHRNILPGSQRIQHTFGPPRDHDSVECDFVNPFGSVVETVKVPVLGTYFRPKRLSIVGLSSSRQAFWHAYRAYQRMQLQRQRVSMRTTEEGGAVGLMQRVLVADRTRAGVQDGEVLGVSGGTVIRTSQPCALTPGRTYTLFLQAPDGTVQSRAVVSSANPFLLTLASAPSPAPITDPAAGVRTLYFLVADDEAAPTAYLVTEAVPVDRRHHEIEAVNYSHQYYHADGLQTWAVFTNLLSDISPMRRPLTNSGGIMGGGLWTGSGLSYFERSATAEDNDNTTPSYTKIAWINAATPAGIGELVATTNAAEQFHLTNLSLLVGGHDNAIGVSQDFSAFLGVMTHVALTYSAVTERMALFIDGALVDEGSIVPPAAPGQNRYLEGHAGTCREVLRWGRCLSDREVREHYVRTRT